jgi:arylformamidase
MLIHDLTRTLEPGMPVYPGDPEVRFQTRAEIGTHGYRVTEMRLGTHAGTHLDAPAHFLEDGQTVDHLELEKLAGPARVVDAAHSEITVRAGERLLFCSGWSARWGEAGYFTRFPALPDGLVERIAAAPAALIGLETPSLHPEPGEDARRHRLLLRAGVAIVENLVNLDLLPEQVFLAALPLPLAGCDGAPCRVIALDMPGARESERA